MRRGWMALSGALLACAVAATAAYAGSDHWFTGTLTPGYGFASAESHSIEYIEGSGNFNGFCIAKDSGISGYDLATRTPAGTVVCASSGGFVNRTENAACCYHGWISNGTSNDLVVASSTHYSY